MRPSMHKLHKKLDSCRGMSGVEVLYYLTEKYLWTVVGLIKCIKGGLSAPFCGKGVCCDDKESQQQMKTWSTVLQFSSFVLFRVSGFRWCMGTGCDEFSAIATQLSLISSCQRWFTCVGHFAGHWLLLLLSIMMMKMMLLLLSSNLCCYCYPLQGWARQSYGQKVKGVSGAWQCVMVWWYRLLF